MNAIILDTETIGLSDPRPVEVAYVGLENWLQISAPVFCQRYNPGKAIEAGAMATHHITDADVADCLPHTDFRLPADTEYLIGHNIDFDWKAINTCGRQLPVRRICTLAMSRYLWPEADSHKLTAMLYLLDPDYAAQHSRSAHSAADDVRMTFRLLVLILEKLDAIGSSVSNFEELLAFSDMARTPKLMPFGKHKGKPFSQIPASYKDWLLDQPDIDPYLRKALTAA